MAKDGKKPAARGKAGKKKMRRRMETPSFISGILDSPSNDRLIRKAARLYKLRRAWPIVMGEQLAKRCEPVDVTDKKLVIAAFGSVWMHELQYLKTDILKRICEIPGFTKLSQVIVKQGETLSREQTEAKP